MAGKTPRLRVALMQMNPTVGDLEGNAARISGTIRRAKGAGADIVAFPELALCGYPPEDLLLGPRFLADCERRLSGLAREARGITVLVGAPETAREEGRRPYNTCWILHGGRIAARYRKINLPNYGVFDEMRYFSPGLAATVLQLGGAAIGVSICEDMWMDDGPTPYQARRGGAGIIINISASPYHRGKGRERERLMSRRARENRCYLCYVNQVGGQDELVFDGSTLVADPRGITIARAAPFEEDLLVVDIDTTAVPARPVRLPRGATGRSQPIEPVRLPKPFRSGRRPHVLPRIESHLDPVGEIYRALVTGTRDYVAKNGFAGVIIGLSGGIDSALTAAVAVDALGTDRVRGLTMPSAYTSPRTLADARRLADNLGIEIYEIPIGPVYESYLEALDPIFRERGLGVTEENIQARVRGNLLMALSNKFGWLVLATGNKSEVAVGYCTLYGDMAGGFAVLKDVPKTLVYRLARWRNRRGGRGVIPSSTIGRAPSAELRPGQCDQDTLPPYPLLDRIIELYVERNMPFAGVIAAGIDPATARRVIRMIDRNEYKRRQAPPGIKITPKAFGRDRRLPITNRYRHGGKD